MCDGVGCRCQQWVGRVGTVGTRGRHARNWDDDWSLASLSVTGQREGQPTVYKPCSIHHFILFPEECKDSIWPTANHRNILWNKNLLGMDIILIHTLHAPNYERYLKPHILCHNKPRQTTADPHLKVVSYCSTACSVLRMVQHVTAYDIIVFHYQPSLPLTPLTLVETTRGHLWGRLHEARIGQTFWLLCPIWKSITRFFFSFSWHEATIASATIAQTNTS